MSEQLHTPGGDHITIISLSELRFPAVSFLPVTPVDTSKHELERKEQQPEELPVSGVAKCDRDGKAEHGHIGQAGCHRRSTQLRQCADGARSVCAEQV